MHPLHQAIKKEEERQSALEGLTILFGVPLGLCYLVAIVFPFWALRDENCSGMAFSILSFLNAICGAVAGFLGGCVFAWKREVKTAATFFVSGLLLWLFAMIMFRLVVFIYGIPLGKPVFVG